MNLLISLMGWLLEPPSLHYEEHPRPEGYKRPSKRSFKEAKTTTGWFNKKGSAQATGGLLELDEVTKAIVTDSHDPFLEFRPVTEDGKR